MKCLLFLGLLLACGVEKDLPARYCRMTLRSVRSIREWYRDGLREKQVQTWQTEEKLTYTLVYPYTTPFPDTVGTVRYILTRF